jgi:hypothetical protein
MLHILFSQITNNTSDIENLILSLHLKNYSFLKTFFGNCLSFIKRLFPEIKRDIITSY